MVALQIDGSATLQLTAPTLDLPCRQRITQQTIPHAAQRAAVIDDGGMQYLEVCFLKDRLPQLPL